MTTERSARWRARALVAALSLVPLTHGYACTIGVASGRVTQDGRPLVWKVRDQPTHPSNHVVWIDSPDTPYRFVGVANSQDTLVWMGVNEAGFALVNANSLDLSDRADFGNGSLMHHALGHCRSVTDFFALLDLTNTPDMRDVHANYGVIDASGEAWMVEVSDTQYWAYDANDTASTPEGFIVRTNFSFHGGGSSGMARYLRSRALISGFCAGDSLSCRTLVRFHARDFSDAGGEPIPVPYPGQWNPSVPYGYIWTALSICRSSTVSGVVIRGVIPGEPPWLSTMWTLLGQTAASIAVPVWPVGPPPAPLAGQPTAPLCELALEIRALVFDCAHQDYLDSYKLRSDAGWGFWPRVFLTEDSLFCAIDSLLATPPRRATGREILAQVESVAAGCALAGLAHAYEVMLSALPGEEVGARIDGGEIAISWAPMGHRFPSALAEEWYEVTVSEAPWREPVVSILTSQPRCRLPLRTTAGRFISVCPRQQGCDSTRTWWWIQPVHCSPDGGSIPSDGFPPRP